MIFRSSLESIFGNFTKSTLPNKPENDSKDERKITRDKFVTRNVTYIKQKKKNCSIFNVNDLIQQKLNITDENLDQAQNDSQSRNKINQIKSSSSNSIKCLKLNHYDSNKNLMSKKINPATKPLHLQTIDKVSSLPKKKTIEKTNNVSLKPKVPQLDVFYIIILLILVNPRR